MQRKSALTNVYIYFTNSHRQIFYSTNLSLLWQPSGNSWPDLERAWRRPSEISTPWSQYTESPPMASLDILRIYFFLRLEITCVMTVWQVFLLSLKPTSCSCSVGRRHRGGIEIRFGLYLLQITVRTYLLGSFSWFFHKLCVT